MDKNEYNLKLQEINRYVEQESYAEAAQCADQIEWKRVRNVHTLCLISEVYEAVDRLEDSKQLLVRAYRRSPVGKTVLFRLTEITIKLKQFDEAIEYYSEYVQAAPHDNNRYILKYKIYRGRGSSVDEQIEILKEYLDQEFNEKYAYELARLYQQADRIQECLAQCDDLVLWFQSGHYVLKALQLKQRYARLTPKQQVILERELSREESGDAADELGQEKQMVSAETAGEADSIMEDAAKAIAETVKASVAEDGDALSDVQTEEEENREAAAATRDILAQQLEEAWPEETKEPEGADAETAEAVAEAETDMSADAAEADAETAENATEADAETAEEAAEADTETAENIAEAVEETAENVAETDTETAESDAEAIAEEETEEEPAGHAVSYDPLSLQEDVAQSMRQIVSGVGIRDTVDPDEEAIDEVIERSKKDQETSAIFSDAGLGVRMNSRLQMPARRNPAAAGKLSIDDVLLSMGEKGTAVREAVAKAGMPSSQPAGVLSAVDEALLNMGVSPEQLDHSSQAGTGRLHSDTMEEIGVTGDTQELPDLGVVDTGEDEAGAEMQVEAAEETAAVETAERDDIVEAVSEEPAVTEDLYAAPEEPASEADAEEADAMPDAMPAEGEEADTEEPQAEENSQADNEEENEVQPEEQTEDEEDLREYTQSSDENGEDDTEEASGEHQNMTMEDIVNARTRRIPREQIEERLAEAAQSENDEEEEQPQAEVRPRRRRRLPRSIRGFFDGFTAVPDMEMQIDSALRLALGKGKDRTSRSGNVLIFGGHGSGKTTLATALAKAIGTAQNQEFVKMAKIYATELNHRDIAATIAKIAGGILIIEEAGDMEDSIADQLTTAMEFRTDGLIILMEDEERYLRSLMIRHPRLMMKFTSQIIIPAYSVQDLLSFAQCMADEKQCFVGEEAKEALEKRLESALQSGTPLTLIEVRDIVERAVKRSAKLSRRMFGGKGRYDEEGRVQLLAKDFR